MRIKIYTLAMLSLLTLSSTVSAETRYFIDGVLGQAGQKNSVGGFNTISANDSSMGVRAGFYLNRAIGVEFVHMDYGDAEDSFIDEFGDTINDTLDTRWMGAGLQGVLPLSHRVKLAGRIGLAAWKLKLTNTDSAFPGQRVVEKDEGVDAYVGVGLRFDIEDNVRVALEYETMDFSAALGVFDTDQTIDNIGVSIGILF